MGLWPTGERRARRPQPLLRLFLAELIAGHEPTESLGKCALGIEALLFGDKAGFARRGAALEFQINSQIWALSSIDTTRALRDLTTNYRHGKPPPYHAG